MPDRLLEEGLCCGYISPAAELEVNRLPSLVDRAIEIDPLSAYFDIGLIDSPRAANGPVETAPTLDELWCIPPDPAQNRRSAQVQPALGHHLDQIAQAELIAQVPTNAQDDHLAVKMPSYKQVLDAPQLAHSSPRLPKTTVLEWDSLFAPEPPEVH
jgi:hypothetical protein